MQKYGGNTNKELKFTSGESGTAADRPTLKVTYTSGPPCTEDLGDFVWDDTDRDGLQDVGEVGLVGVTVNLRKNSDNSLIQATATDATGAYTFTDVATDTYYIETIAPYNYGISPKDIGGDNTVDSDATPSNGRTDSFSWTLADPQDITIDTGMYESYIGDFIWDDADDDGIQDGGETGIAGATVKLFLSSDLTTEIDQMVTDSTGEYRFYNPATGTYVIEVTPPSGKAFGSAGPGRRYTGQRRRFKRPDRVHIVDERRCAGHQVGRRPHRYVHRRLCVAGHER